MTNGKAPRAVIFAAVSTPEQAADDRQSLDTQENELRAIAHAHGWKVIKVLRVPGFSRDYISFEECAGDMLKANPPISAMAELRALCTPDNRPEFDILMVRDADRFGRTQSLIMQIAETVCIRLGLRIYSQMDNQLIEGLQSRFWAAMTGLRAANDQDKRKKYRKDGVARRASTGKLIGTWEPFTHAKLYNEKHQVIGTAVREDRRYLFDAVYQLVVEERCSMYELSFRLAERGFFHPETGRRFHAYQWYHILHSPVTWGHVIQHYQNFIREKHDGEWYGLWALGEEWGTPPEPIHLHYNVLPPVYTGLQAETLKAELRRRKMMTGSRRPGTTHILSGLLVCGGCGYSMNFGRIKDWRAYRCITASDPRFQSRAECRNEKKSIREQDAIDAVLAILGDVLGCPEDSYFERLNGEQQSIDQLAQSEMLLTEVNRRIDTLIQKQAAAPASISGNYDAQIQTAAEQKEHLEKSIAGLRLQSRPSISPGRTQAIEDVRSMRLSGFQSLPEASQHQLLERIFEGYRFEVIEGEIVGLIPAPPHYR